MSPRLCLHCICHYASVITLRQGGDEVQPQQSAAINRTRESQSGKSPSGCLPLLAFVLLGQLCAVRRGEETASMALRLLLSDQTLWSHLRQTDLFPATNSCCNQTLCSSQRSRAARWSGSDHKPPSHAPAIHDHQVVILIPHAARRAWPTTHHLIMCLPVVHAEKALSFVVNLGSVHHRHCICCLTNSSGARPVCSTRERDAAARLCSC